MTATAQTLRPPSRTLMFLEGRAIHEFGAFLGALPLLSLAPRGDGHPVLVLPGLVASDTSTRALRAFLIRRGRDPEGVELKAMVPISVRADAERGAQFVEIGVLRPAICIGRRIEIGDEHRRVAVSGGGMGKLYIMLRYAVS